MLLGCIFVLMMFVIEVWCLFVDVDVLVVSGLLSDKEIWLLFVDLFSGILILCWVYVDVIELFIMLVV